MFYYKKSDVESPNSEVKSQKSEAGFQNTKVQPHTSEVFYKKSDVEYQNSEVKIPEVALRVEAGRRLLR